GTGSYRSQSDTGRDGRDPQPPGPGARHSVAERGVQDAKASTHNPTSAATGIKQSSAHQGEWPVRFNTMPAGIANNASAAIKMTSMEGSSIGIITVPIQGTPAGA